MHQSLVSSALLLLGAFSHLVRGTALGGSFESLRLSNHVAPARKRESEGLLEGRMLRAAQLKSDISTREIHDTLRHDHILHYLGGKYTSVTRAQYAKMSPVRRVLP